MTKQIQAKQAAAKPFVPVRFAVLTVSDSRSLAEDRSGDTLAERIAAAGHVLQARDIVPDDSGLDAMEPLMGPLTTMTAFDLGQERLPDFASYRFLYERLLGGHARPWLPGAFCAAASLPHLHPDKRRTLLQSISEAAATAPGWSAREPSFYPEWVDKIDETRPAN